MEHEEKKQRPSWQEIEEKKINLVKEKGSRVMRVNSPIGSTMFSILRQFDMAYANFKGRLGEMGGIQPGSPVIGTDPTTGITGLKFDEGFDDGETRYYYFTVDGNLAEDDVVTVASKGGAGYDTALITGPSTTCSPLANPAIDIEKSINGEDADTAPGVVLSEGDAITFEFVVTNTGDVDLTDVLVTDDVLGAICGVGFLEVGDTFTCSIGGVTAAAGQHTNTGTATASYNDAVVSDSDPANYYTESPTPQIDIEKYINGDDADLLRDLFHRRDRLAHRLLLVHARGVAEERRAGRLVR